MKENQMIVLPNGQEVLNLTPTLEGQLAIVHLAVIQRLAKLLPTTNFENYKFDFLEGLSRVQDLPTFVGVMADEVAFHNTVNLIITVDMGTATIKAEETANGKQPTNGGPKIVGKISLDSIH